MARKKWGIMVPFPDWTTPLWVTKNTDLAAEILSFDTKDDAETAAKIWRTYRVRAFWEPEMMQRKEDT